MKRNECTLGCAVRIFCGACYPDRTPIPTRFCRVRWSVVSRCGDYALLFPLMRHVHVRYLTRS
ncbi:MAG: hypothetical protein IKT43_05190 [Clostridia bacterium]|nr:hypothetical protein [Clostridia bacterium]